MKRTYLGEILIEMGALDTLQLRSALAHQRQWGIPLGRVIVEKRFCSSDQVLEALARQTGLSSIDLDQEQLDRGLVQLVTKKVAQQHRLVPVRLRGPRCEELVVGIAAPASLASLDAARAVSRKPRVIGLLALDNAIDRAIERLYGQSAPAMEQELELARPRRLDEIERSLKLNGAQWVATDVLVYGWPASAERQIVNTLTSHCVVARVGGALQAQTAAPEDIIIAPIPAMEELVRTLGPVRARLIVIGRIPERDLARAHRLGAHSFLVAPLDLDLLLRAIRRCEEATPASALGAASVA
jgi:type IV pilus assembly protein PilB